MFFGTDQILVRQRYGYKLHRSSLENLYRQWSGSEQGYIVYLTAHLLLVNNNLSPHNFFGLNCNIKFKVEAFLPKKSYKKMTSLATSG